MEVWKESDLSELESMGGEVRERKKTGSGRPAFRHSGWRRPRNLLSQEVAWRHLVVPHRPDGTRQCLCWNMGIDRDEDSEFID